MQFSSWESSFELFYETLVNRIFIFEFCRRKLCKLRRETCKNFAELKLLCKNTNKPSCVFYKMLDFLHEKNILRTEGSIDKSCDYFEILKGEIVMLVAFGTFGALYLAGMIAMTVHGLKD